MHPANTSYTFCVFHLPERINLPRQAIKPFGLAGRLWRQTPQHTQPAGERKSAEQIYCSWYWNNILGARVRVVYYHINVSPLRRDNLAVGVNISSSTKMCAPPMLRRRHKLRRASRIDRSLLASGTAVIKGNITLHRAHKNAFVVGNVGDKRNYFGHYLSITVHRTRVSIHGWWLSRVWFTTKRQNRANYDRNAQAQMI